MRILIVNTWYYPNLMGGAEHSVKLLAEGLVKSGHDVAVYCIDNRETGLIEESINGVKVYRGNGGKYNLYKAYETDTNMLYKVFQKTIEVFNPTIAKEYTEVCEKFKPQVIHTNCISGMSLHIWSLSNKMNLPIIHTLRDYWLLSPRSILENHKEINAPYRLYLTIFQKYCKKKSLMVSMITAPSEFTLNAHVAHGLFKRVESSKCIVNSIEYDPSLINNHIKEKVSRANKGVKFIYAGWLSEIKGIRHLIEAFREVDRDDIELIICGDGELKEFVEKSVSLDRRISYLGKIGTDELKLQYKLSDVLIISSIWDEPFGRVVIEANSFGLPVIASNKGGIPEIIGRMKSGITYPAGNKRILKELIVKMSDRNQLTPYYESILRNMHYYSIDEQINQFIQLYSKVQQ